MSLDICGKMSNEKYHYGYSGIHQIRYVAYTLVGYKGDFSGFMKDYYYEHYEDKNKLNDLVNERFPNLMLHSDCEGGYTLDGKIDKKTFLTGNSKELLRELEFIKENAPREISKKEVPYFEILFKSLYDLVKDEVENGEGVLIFS